MNFSWIYFICGNFMIELIFLLFDPMVCRESCAIYENFIEEREKKTHSIHINPRFFLFWLKIFMFLT